MSNAEFIFQHGNDYPYDGQSDRNAVMPARNGAEGAVRGILADLTDRRGIKHPLGNLDLSGRQNLFGTLVEIVKRNSAKEAAQDILKHIEDFVPGFSHEMDNVDDDIRGEMIEELADIISYAAKQHYPLQAQDD